MSDIKMWLWLTLADGIASRKISALFERFDSVSEIYTADENSLKGIDGISKKDIISLCNKDMTKTEEVISDCKRKGIRILTYDSPLYPQNLKHIFDPPYVLYVKSKERIDLNQHLLISIVGNRRITKYGELVTNKFAKALSLAGVTIVSGMARGVDGAAHSGALSVGGVTVAVLGCGPDICYPLEHKKMMAEIAETGLIISEYPPGTPPASGNFPRRNRIISGMSVATLVTEAAQSSGSLITANYALEQNREIFAIPGDITNRHSDGCNALIRSAGAKAVISPEDILSEFRQAYADRLEKNKPTPKEKTKTVCLDNETFGRLSDKEKLIVKSMEALPIHIDKISEKTGLKSDEVSSALTMLEICGIIKAYPGKKFGLSLGED